MSQVTSEYSPGSHSTFSSVDRAERDIVAITNSIVPDVVGSYIGFGSYTVVNIQPYKCNFSLNQMGVWDDMHVNSKQLSIVRHAPEF
jgi:hypothetical protein